MKVPAGTDEYQASIRKSKDLLNRLKKGSKMLDEALDKNEYLQAQKVIRHWEKLSKDLFTELEIATLTHQFILTGNQFLIKSDGTLIAQKEMVNQETLEIDPWTLISLEKLKAVFGDEVNEFLVIEEKPSS